MLKEDNSVQVLNTLPLSNNGSQMAQKLQNVKDKLDQEQMDKDNLRLMLKILNAQSAETVGLKGIKKHNDRADHHRYILSQKKSAQSPVDVSNQKMMKSMVEQQNRIKSKIQEFKKKQKGMIDSMNENSRREPSYSPNSESQDVFNKSQLAMTMRQKRIDYGNCIKSVH